MGTMAVRYSILIIFLYLFCFKNSNSYAQDGVLRLISEKQDINSLIRKFKELNKPLVYYQNNIYAPDSACYTVRTGAEASDKRTFENYQIRRNNEEFVAGRKFEEQNSIRKRDAISEKRKFERELSERNEESLLARRNGVEEFRLTKEQIRADSLKKEQKKDGSRPTKEKTKKIKRTSFSLKGCFWGTLSGLFGGCGGIGKGCFNIFAPKSAKDRKAVQVIAKTDFFCNKIKKSAAFEIVGLEPTEKIQVIDVFGIRDVTAGFIDYH